MANYKFVDTDQLEAEKKKAQRDRIKTLMEKMRAMQP